MTKSIASLLALAVTTSVALANGGEGDKGNPFAPKGSSWRPGSGVMLSDTDELGLKMTNQLQVGWNYDHNENAADTNSFDVRRARTSLSGHAFSRDIRFKLQVDYTDTNETVKDAWAHWALNDMLGVRLGQSKTGFGLEATGSSAGLFFVDRSAATRGATAVRSRGVWVNGSHNENSLRWNAGLQNANSEEGDDLAGTGDTGALDFVANVSFDPMGDITGGKGNEGYTQGNMGGSEELRGTIGAGYMLENGDGQSEATTMNINTAWHMAGGIALQAEMFLRNDDNGAGTDFDTTSYYAQAMYALPKTADSGTQWGLGLRYSSIDPDGDDNNITELSLVLNAFYYGHNAKTQIEYTIQDVDATDQTNDLLKAQFTLVF